MKSRLSLIVIAVGVLALASPAFAHAFLDHSEPAVGSTVGKSPTSVAIWFTQQPEPAFSRIEVYNSDGKQVDKKDTHRSDKVAKELIVSLPDLPAGTYKVVWQVVSIDTHKTRGDFKFTIQP